MTSADVGAIVEAELSGDRARFNALGVDRRGFVIPPRQAACRIPPLPPNQGADQARELWIVFEERSGTKDGYLVIFDEQERDFGLAVWGEDVPVLIGFYGSFLDTLEGM
jgi:hypothetical protein